MDSAIENIIINSVTRSDLGSEEIGRSDSAIEQGRNLSDLSIEVLPISRFILS